jgi:hypothetical protein
MATKKKKCGCCREHGHINSKKSPCPNKARIQKKKERKEFHKQLIKVAKQFAKKALKKNKIHNKKKSSHIMNRVTTMAYEAMRDYVDNVLDTKQPEFTAKDKAMKEEIFGFKGKTSFLSGVKCKGVGDHIRGVREGIQAGYNWVGSNSKWNTVLVIHAENVSYKKVKTGKKTKNLAYDEFSTEEQNKFSGLQMKIYTSIKRWEKYVESRGAHMYWENQRKNDDKFKAKAVELCLAYKRFVLNTA